MHDRPAAPERLALMRRLLVVLSVGALSAGCAAVEWLGVRPEASRPAPTVASSVARPDDPAHQKAALELYARIAAEPARDADHARALYNLARLYTNPAGGLRDYRAARLAFDSLLNEYPRGEWDAEARAWCAVLDALAARERELEAREGELEARDGELHVREAELARLKQEAARLGADLQRLRKIDLNLERRR